MNNLVYTTELVPPYYNFNEINRYMGLKNPSEEVDRLITECIKECNDIFTYRICYSIFEVQESTPQYTDLTFAKIHSASLFKYLKGCDRIVLFASTVGIGIDRLISKYSIISPSKSLCFHSIGTERVEALCNYFAQMIKKEYGSTKTRISPGYGDLDITIQKEIFNVLRCQKSIGLTLNDSMIMSPSKSVSAIIGIERK